MRQNGWAYSSAGERLVDIEEVTSSILVTPTIRKPLDLIYNPAWEPYPERMSIRCCHNTVTAKVSLCQQSEKETAAGKLKSDA
jgi:hypothetical protein